MPVSRMFVGSVSVSRPGATGEQRGEQRGEVPLDVGVGLLEHRHDLDVDGLDDPTQLAPRVLHVLELTLQELVTLLQRLVLLERERVDRAHELDLALDLAGPAGERRTLGHLGRGRGERDRGLDVEVGAEALDRVLEPHLRLGLFDLTALDLLAQPGELPFEGPPLGAQGLELGAGGAGGLGAGPAPELHPLVDLVGRGCGARRAGSRGRA